LDLKNDKKLISSVLYDKLSNPAKKQETSTNVFPRDSDQREEAPRQEARG